MEPVYRVILGDNHVVFGTYSYEDAKKQYLLWVETLQTQNVLYKSVTVTKDHEPLLEYIRK